MVGKFFGVCVACLQGVTSKLYSKVDAAGCEEGYLIQNTSELLV